jgi:hypothetical protein
MARVGPVYEAIVGVADVAAAERYWGELGYRRIAAGTLEAAQAEALYGWPSAAQVVRLQNGEHGDYSLVRLVGWERLRPGRPADFTCISYGMRWSAALVDGIVDLYDSFKDGEAAGEGWKVNDLVRGWMGDESPPSFFRRPVVMREFLVTGPETRQVFFGRTGFTRPGYGHTYPTSPRGVGPFTHHGIVLPFEVSLDWFTQALGYEVLSSHDLHDGRIGSRVHLELRPGQRLLYTRLVAPGFGEGQVFTFQPYYIAPDARAVCLPGAPGITWHSFRTTDLAGTAAASREVGCHVGERTLNEFGEETVSVVSPGGLWWSLIGSEELQEQGG